MVQRLLRSRMSRFRACYERGLKRDASLRGQVMLSFVIQLDGRVASAESVPKSKAQPNGTDVGDASVVSCVVRALQGITFPRPNGDQLVKAKARIALRP